MPHEHRSITVHIAGENLSLKTDRDERFLQDLADYIGDKVEDIRRGARGVPSHRVYLLVALQLADELFAERENARALCDEVSARSELLLGLLDTELANLPSQTAADSTP